MFITLDRILQVFIVRVKIFTNPKLVWIKQIKFDEFLEYLSAYKNTLLTQINK